jgi:transcriptional regulator with XRE-family HTH domain
MPKRADAASELAAGVLAGLAQAVRGNRQRRGWTLAGLAERTGVSKGMLMQIESGRTNPSISTLIRIANAFGVGVWQLVEPVTDELRVADATAAVILWRSPAGGTASLLIGAQSPQVVELWEWRLPPGDGYVAETHLEGTFEVLHVRKGTLALDLGGNRTEIRAGGSAVARTDQPHGYHNGGRGWLELSMTVIEPRR